MLNAASGHSTVVQTTKAKPAPETGPREAMAIAAAAAPAAESPAKSILASTVPRCLALFVTSCNGALSSFSAFSDWWCA